jgi:hypothetical protein
LVNAAVIIISRHGYVIGVCMQGAFFEISLIEENYFVHTNTIYDKNKLFY